MEGKKWERTRGIVNKDGKIKKGQTRERNKEGETENRKEEKEEAERWIFGECHLPNLVTMLSQLWLISWVRLSN